MLSNKFGFQKVPVKQISLTYAFGGISTIITKEGILNLSFMWKRKS